MEHDRVLWLAERTSCLWAGSGREGDLEAFSARTQATIEKWA